MSGFALLNHDKTAVLRYFPEPEKFFVQNIYTELQTVEGPEGSQQIEVQIDASKTYMREYFSEPMSIRKVIGLYDVVDDEYPDQYENITTHHTLEIFDHENGIVKRHWVSAERPEDSKLEILSKASESVCDQIDQKRDELGNAGFTYNGHTFQLRGTSDPLNFVSQALFAFLTLNTEFKTMIAQISQELADQIVWNPQEKWTDINNVDVTIPTAQNMIIMALTAATSKKRAIRNAITHKQAVRALAENTANTPEEIKNYDYSQGW